MTWTETFALCAVVLSVGVAYWRHRRKQPAEERNDDEGPFIGGPWAPV